MTDPLRMDIAPQPHLHFVTAAHHCTSPTQRPLASDRCRRCRRVVRAMCMMAKGNKAAWRLGTAAWWKWRRSCRAGRVDGVGQRCVFVMLRTARRQNHACRGGMETAQKNTHTCALVVLAVRVAALAGAGQSWPLQAVPVRSRPRVDRCTHKDVFVVQPSSKAFLAVCFLHSTHTTAC